MHGATLSNFINIDDEEKYIYRIMPVYRLLESFEKGALSLVEPSEWDDPFENLLLKGAVPHGSNDSIINNIFRNSVYGQCWTLHRETDAMWRIYSADKQGVKVRTTIRKLIDALLSSADGQEVNSCFIGKVDYLTQKELVNRLTGISSMYGEDAARSLLYKRNEFAHEKEVRLIYTMQSKQGSAHSFKIDPHSLYDEIVFDPRINQHIYQAYSEAIKSKGYSGSVRQSVMYQLPKDLVNEFKK
jgi:hypothetical protein